MKIDLEKIKKLRLQTGAGVHDVKKALVDASGDEVKAAEILKKRGHEVMAKKASRETSQGLIASYVHAGRIGALVEVNCETDFVARNEEFQSFVKEIAMQIASSEVGSVDELLAQEYFRDNSITVSDLLKQTALKVGENIKISRLVRFELGGL